MIHRLATSLTNASATASSVQVDIGSCALERTAGGPSVPVGKRGFNAGERETTEMEKGLVPSNQVALVFRDVPHLELGQDVLI